MMDHETGAKGMESVKGMNGVKGVKMEKGEMGKMRTRLKYVAAVVLAVVAAGYLLSFTTAVVDAAVTFRYKCDDDLGIVFGNGRDYDLLYVSSGDTLQLKHDTVTCMTLAGDDVTMTGTVSAAAGTDDDSRFGRMKIGALTSDVAAMGHEDCFTEAAAGFRQSASGSVVLNVPTGESLSWLLNYTAETGLHFNSAGLTAYVPIYLHDVGGISSNTAIQITGVGASFELNADYAGTSTVYVMNTHTGNEVANLDVENDMTVQGGDVLLGKNGAATGTVGVYGDADVVELAANRVKMNGDTWGTGAVYVSGGPAATLPDNTPMAAMYYSAGDSASVLAAITDYDPLTFDELWVFATQVDCKASTIIVNIGELGCSFTDPGGLNLVDDLQVNGGEIGTAADPDTITLGNEVVTLNAAELHGSVLNTQQSYIMAGGLARMLTAEKGLWIWTTPYTTEASQTLTAHPATYVNCADPERIAKGFVWAINPVSFNEYAWASDHADFEFTSGSSDSAFSFLAWIQVTDQAGVRTILSKWDSTTATPLREYELQILADETLLLRCFDESADKFVDRDTDAAVSTGWHLLAVTRNGGTGATAMDTAIFYVDGVAVASTATGDAGYVCMEDLTTNVFIGAQTLSDGNAGLFLWGDFGAVCPTGEVVSAETMWEIWLWMRGFYNV